MGCDIHLYVEHKLDGKWAPVSGEFYDQRNYSLFAILANVRNGADFKPITKYRGLPSDVSKVVLQKSESWDLDAHNHNWLLLSELLSYDWTQTVRRTGVVSALEYDKWCKYDRQHGEAPDQFCGVVFGSDVVMISEEDMEKRLADKTLPDKWNNARRDAIATNLHGVYCHVTWTEPYYQCCRSFWSDTIPRLLRLGSPDDVRIVFWFDN